MGGRYEGRRDGDEEVFFFRLEETVEVEGGCRCHVSVRQHGSAESLEAAFGCDGRLAGPVAGMRGATLTHSGKGKWANDATAGRKITRNLKKRRKGVAWMSAQPLSTWTREGLGESWQNNECTK